MNILLLTLLFCSNPEMKDTTNSNQDFNYAYNKSANAYFQIAENYSGKFYLGGNHPMYYQCPKKIGMIVLEEDLIKANSKASIQKGHTHCL